MGFPIPDSGSVTEDSGVVGGLLTASGDIDYFLVDDTGEWTAETITGAYGSQLVIDADGNWTYTADNSDPAIQALNTGQSLTEVFNVTSLAGTSTITITINGVDEPPCFLAGTLVETPAGPRAVEDLAVGDLVLTEDEGPQPVRWIGRSSAPVGHDAVPEAFRPVRIRRDALGPGVPRRDLLVSPLHRIVVEAPIAEILFGQRQVLVAGQHLVDGFGVCADYVGPVDYVHLMFDRHQLVRAHGCASESFYPGTVGIGRFGDRARSELTAAFPGLGALPGSYGQAARRILRRHEAALLRATTAPAEPAGALGRAWA